MERRSGKRHDFGSMLNDLARSKNIDEIILTQRHSLREYEETNEMLRQFLELSQATHKIMSEKFSAHVKTLITLKKDLEQSYRRIRDLKTRLKEQYPEAFKETAEAIDELKKKFELEDKRKYEEQSKDISDSTIEQRNQMKNIGSEIKTDIEQETVKDVEVANNESLDNDKIQIPIETEEVIKTFSKHHLDESNSSPNEKIQSKNSITKGSDSEISSETNSAGEISPRKSTLSEDLPNKSSPSELFTDKGSPDKCSPDKVSPDKSFTDKGSPDKCSPDNCSPNKVSLDKSFTDKGSPDKCSPDKCSPDKCLPNKVSPDKSFTDKGSPDKCSPDKCSPNKCSPNKVSPDKSSPDESSPNKCSPNKVSPDKSFTDKSSSGKSSPNKCSPTESTPSNIPNGDISHLSENLAGECSPSEDVEGPEYNENTELKISDNSHVYLTKDE